MAWLGYCAVCYSKVNIFLLQIFSILHHCFHELLLAATTKLEFGLASRSHNKDFFTSGSKKILISDDISSFFLKLSSFFKKKKPVKVSTFIETAFVLFPAKISTVTAATQQRHLHSALCTGMLFIDFKLTRQQRKSHYF